MTIKGNLSRSLGQNNCEGCYNTFKYEDIVLYPRTRNSPIKWFLTTWIGFDIVFSKILWNGSREKNRVKC